MAALGRKVDATTAAHAEAAARLEAKRQRLRECDMEIRALEKEADGLRKRVQEVEVERRRQEHK